MLKISIIDYKMGNINTISRQLTKLGAACDVINTPNEILNAEKLILPGVGHFGSAMEYLNNQGLTEALSIAVLEQNTPILGICLGMQLMTAYSEEGNAKGLGWFDAKVTRFDIKNSLKYKVPHIGWNEIEYTNEHPLLKNIPQNSEFYFVHAYQIESVNENEVLTRTTYENSFVSGIVKGNIYGVQFHPEKSHEVGLKLLKNFIEL